MKSILFGLFLASTGVQAAPVLGEIEQEDLLRSIDTICGDTWCEGDSNWSFDAIACDSETGCVLNLTMRPYDFEEYQILAARSFSCDLPQFTSKERLVETTVRGLQHTEELYEAVSECIGELTESFGPIYVPIDTTCSSLFNPKTANFVYRTSKKVNSSGIYGAIEAVSQIVSKKSKIDDSCELQREPYYRDSADCFTVNLPLPKDGTEPSEVQICILPSLSGSYKVTLDDSGHASVEYMPGSVGTNVYKTQPGQAPSTPVTAPGDF